MSPEREGRETLQAKMQAARGQGWRKPNLEQPKRLVYKKIIKPLMEKKRRDRIAHSLNQLKALLLDVPNQGGKMVLTEISPFCKPDVWAALEGLSHKEIFCCQSFSSSRMDKAALLEMTVKRIQTLQLAVAEDRGLQTEYPYCASFVQATISERQQYLEAPSQSSPSYETFSLITSPPASDQEKISSWKEKLEAFPRLQCSGRLVSSVVLRKAGSQVFWRPWST